jgi:hypothetical protein
VKNDKREGVIRISSKAVKANHMSRNLEKRKDARIVIGLSFR